MRIFKTKVFARFARSEGISDKKLIEAVTEIENGQFDANLGGGLIKKRVARDDEGKSGGYRTLVAYRSATRSLFLYGFAKSEKDNIKKDELSDLKKLSKIFLSNSDEAIKKALDDGKIEVILYENKI